MRAFHQAMTLLFLGAMLAAPPSSQAQTAKPDAGPVNSAHNIETEDRDFLSNAAQAGHLEIEGSKMALRKSANLDIKTFAQRMIDDHGKVAQELAGLARNKGVEIPGEPSLMQKGVLKGLDLRSDGFDEAYADSIAVSAHKDAVELFDKAAREAKDAEVKAFAARVLPQLKQHLAMGQELQRKVSAKQKQKD